MGETSTLTGVFAYFLVLSILLPLAGFGSNTVSYPEGSPTGLEEGEQQSFLVAGVECIFTAFQDCSRSTQTKFVTAIGDGFSYMATTAAFLFQFLTFQIDEIPVALNIVLVVPPAVILLWYGVNAIRGRSVS